LYLAFGFEDGSFGEVTALQAFGALLGRLLLEILVQYGVGRLSRSRTQVAVVLSLSKEAPDGAASEG
jgi:hypothetical protein